MPQSVNDLRDRVLFKVMTFLSPNRPLLEFFDKSYYITIPYEQCKLRRRCVKTAIKNSWVVLILSSWNKFLLFISVQDNTPSPTLLGSLRVTCGPCTWNTEMTWRTAVCQLVWYMFFRVLSLNQNHYILDEYSFCFTSASKEYLDGLKTKDEIYNQVYEDIHNTLLNRL